jgi:hypothetical protein
MQVIFKLNHAETKMGQRAHIIGGSSQLGAWDVSILNINLLFIQPKKAPKLTANGTYPKW